MQHVREQPRIPRRHECKQTEMALEYGQTLTKSNGNNFNHRHVFSHQRHKKVEGPMSAPKTRSHSKSRAPPRDARKATATSKRKPEKHFGPNTPNICRTELAQIPNPNKRSISFSKQSKPPPEPSYQQILALLEAANAQEEPHLAPFELLDILRRARRQVDPKREQTILEFLNEYQGNYEEPGILVTEIHRVKEVEKNMAPTPILEEFLQGISRILREQNGKQMQEWLIVEPPYAPHYHAMIAELKASYPSGSEDLLDAKCAKLLPEARNGIGDSGTWSPFIKFMAQYLIFLREVDPSNLLETYNQLSELVQKANSAFTHPSLGILLLGSIIVYSKLLARLAIGLDKQPELIAGLAEQSAEDGGERLTLPERAANMLRQAFVTCLMDRSSGASGRKAGIYTIANLCLKILFQCKKTRNGFQIFNMIYQHSPPISFYPAAQRVTFLYYLGRFQFSTSHFYRAQLALQSAYDQCPVHEQCRKQRRLILIYLLASNVIMGRFPTDALYRLPEADGLRERFQPLCYAIKMGDLATFRRLTDYHHEHAQWFLYFRIFLQLRNRCEVLVWRSLIRRTFILNGEQGGGDTRTAPNMHLADIVQVSRFLEKRALNPLSVSDHGPGKRHTNWIFMQDSAPKDALYTDPDFEGTEDDPDDETEDEDPLCLPAMMEVEAIVASLIHQGLLNGFIAHRLKKFAISGAKTKPALQAGFPNVWDTVSRNYDREVPGWKREERGVGQGMVYNLSGVKEIGAGG
jgi:hypothetical protein